MRQQISLEHFNNKSTISSSGLPYRMNVCALAFLFAPFRTSKQTKLVKPVRPAMIWCSQYSQATFLIQVTHITCLCIDVITTQNISPSTFMLLTYGTEFWCYFFSNGLLLLAQPLNCRFSMRVNCMWTCITMDIYFSPKSEKMDMYFIMWLFSIIYVIQWSLS
jgi:hypothetical protein